MKARIWRKVWLSIGATLGLLALLWLVGTALAQGPEGETTPQGDVSVAAIVANGINYQGRLTNSDGVPLDGSFPMRFRIYESSSAPAWFWDSGPLSVDVDHGLFNVLLDVNPADFNGQALWLEHYVNYELLTPRQELLPVPYALSLRPGAEIVGEPTGGEGWVLKVNMTGFNPAAMAVHGVTATGSAVLGRSDDGSGLSGSTDEGYAVYGLDGGTTQGKGYGGYFESTTGVGVYGYSGATSVWNNQWVPGVYGRSANGVGVMGRGDSPYSSGIGLLAYGRGGAAAQLETFSGDIIRGLEDVDGDGQNMQVRFRVDFTGDVFADRAYHCGFDDGGNATYIEENGGCMYDLSPADFAEVLPAASDPEPGDVVVIGSDGRLTRSSEPYQSSVAGVYSTSPSYVGGAANLDKEGYVPVAVVGLAPVKVSTENGPIQPGDLLTSASLPGHAMKASPVDLDGVEIYRPGTIIGKALERLDEGTGMISVLVTLH